MIELRPYQHECIEAIEVAQIMTHISIDGVETWAGDLRTEQLSALLNTANCNELIVEAWKEHALGRLTLCFTTDVAHARDLCMAFQAAGVAADWVCGETPIDERRDILAKFAQGEIEVLTNCAVLTEGYDHPALDCIILARPTKSTLLYTQMIGRGTRTYPVELSWAFGLAESEARRVTRGNLTLVDKKARWRQDPATDKQIATLAE
jgi:superfamily II DNA or RNA helicase